MKEKDIKLLWGRAANRCAICRCELAQDAETKGQSFPIGEQAHIVAEAVDGPRGSSALTLEQRNSYHNIILLCPNHHTEIDKNTTDWTAEKLFFTKSTHELWVRETLADSADQARLAQQVAVTAIIDSAVELCALESWKRWTGFALGPDPEWPLDFQRNFFEFRQRTIAAIWPDQFDELRRATLTLSIYLNYAANNFAENSKLSDDADCYVADRFYKTNGRFNPNYDRDLDQYNSWLDVGYEYIYKATAAANWFADVVRRDVNPMFFAQTGKFVVVDGPFSDLSFKIKLIEFSEEEKRAMPESINKL